jgi:putative tryptophan/tyrosine transport system substrate-binding protein
MQPTKMDRRRFLLTSLVGACAAPIGAGTEQAGRPRRIGMLAWREGEVWQGFWEGLRRFGWIEGRNITIERRVWKPPKPPWTAKYLSDQARDLVGRGVDVIVTDGCGEAVVARKATPTIPIVFLVTDFDRNLTCLAGNVTGVVRVSTREWWDYHEDLAPRRLELLRELLPRGGTLAILSTSSTDFKWGHRPLLGLEVPFGLEVQRAAWSGLRDWPQTVDVRTDDELECTFARMAREMSSRVLVLPPQRGIDWERIREGIKERARQYKLEPVDMNGLRGMLAAWVYYRSNLTEHCRQAAHYVHMILNGAAPAELPVAWTLSKLDLVIHHRTVKDYGLTVPPSLLARAVRVIE